ncbi:hypothetical protein ABZZ17_17770 [Streptomyces sp. NPDC006512]|uniref:hypothetical protein n=1 Tax=Streptomyces sp. NPDC006512 TaxID=3154307 RepID=UPI0033B66025
MLKPPRTVLALAAGSLVLGLVGAGAAVADEGPVADGPAQEHVVHDDAELNGPVVYPKPRHALGKVVSRGPLKVRSKPSTRGYELGKVYPNQKLALACKLRGEKVDGNDLWYLLDGKDRKEDMNGNEPVNGDDGLEGVDGGDDSASGDGVRAERKRAWVSARYVKDITPVKWCRL